MGLWQSFWEKYPDRKDSKQEKIKSIDYKPVELSPEDIRNKWIYKLVTTICQISSAGNPARDHLSNERTILAFIRTGLNLVLYGLIMLQLAKYVIIGPINEFKGDQFVNQNPQFEELHNFMIHLLDTVSKYSRPVGALVFSMALLVLVIGCIRYYRMQYLLANGDFYESNVIMILLVFLGVLPILVLAFVYVYKM
jgi:uncharacterized membrane protein YidH (DUF202 family)